MITQEYLKSRLDYNPDTGVFTWLPRDDADGAKRWNRLFAGKVAGSVTNEGYRYIWLLGKAHIAHRLAFIYMEGQLPPAHVDHCNNNRDDQRWCNLRHATHSENMMNRRKVKPGVTGYKGVCHHPYKASKNYQARIRHNGVLHSLGYHDTPEEAHSAYVKRANEIFGEFANDGFARA